MSRFSVARARTTDNHNHHPVDKNFSFSSDQMTMMNLLAPKTSKQSNGVVRMPANGASLRSSTTQRHQHQKAADPHRSTTTNFPFRISTRFDSQDSSSSVPVGQHESSRQRICGHQPMTAPANQCSPKQTAADSEVTFFQDSHISNRPFDAPCHHNLRRRRSRTNHPNSHNKNSHNQRMSADNHQEDYSMQMIRQGSHDGNDSMSITSSSPMSVTSALRRSRAIAIHPTKTAHPADLEEQHAQEQSVKIYDQATWRMYNRIVDHRRTHQATLGQTAQGESAASTVVSDNFQTLEVLNGLEFHSNNYDGDDYDDGEIFQLDL